MGCGVGANCRATCCQVLFAPRRRLCENRSPPPHYFGSCPFERPLIRVWAGDWPALALRVFAVNHVRVAKRCHRACGTCSRIAGPKRWGICKGPSSADQVFASHFQQVSPTSSAQYLAVAPRVVMKRVEMQNARRFCLRRHRLRNALFVQSRAEWPSRSRLTGRQEIFVAAVFAGRYLRCPQFGHARMCRRICGGACH